MTPAAVVSHTEQICGLAPSSLRSRDRRRSVAEARSIAAYLARTETGASFTEIGEELQCDRSWACRMVEAVEFRLCFGDARLARTVRAVQCALTGQAGNEATERAISAR